MRRLLLGILSVAAAIALQPSCLSSYPQSSRPPTPPLPVCPPPAGVVVPTFQRDAVRTGWDDAEPTLTTSAVGSSSWGDLWWSAQLDPFVDSASNVYPPHIYASPLYADGMTMTAGPYAGPQLSVLFVATSNAFAYAINAVGTSCNGVDVPYGAILWKTSLGTPVAKSVVLQGGFDGGVPIGVLSTPVLWLGSSVPVLYVVTADGGPNVYRAFALDARSGVPLQGWPVTMDANAVAGTAPPGAPAFGDKGENQRAGLNLSPDGSRLYVGFSSLGWMMVIDTSTARLEAAFPGGPVGDTEQAGIWASAGPAIDANGTVYALTGNGTLGAASKAGYWAESLLAFSPSLQLTGTYTPFNYCDLEFADADFGGDSPMLVDIDPSQTATPRLLVAGSKQGNVYLLDRDHLPGRLDARQACGSDSTLDTSLLPPGGQPQFNGARGPLSVFGPYSECTAPPTPASPCYNNVDYAKMRSAPALYRDASGATYVYVAGASKQPQTTTSVPPSLVRLRVVTQAGAPAYLAIDASNPDVAFINPGSPVVTSDGSQHPVVWVLDEDAQRVASLVDPTVKHPILYAFDGATMQLLWRSADADLFVGGKYNVPAIAHGVVYVGTDRIQAFGLRP